jgi:tetratricopeptide (TPR) repeat protein
MAHPRSSLLACAGLAVLTVAAYGPLWRNDFIELDDEVYITNNPNVLGGLSWQGLEWAWTTFHAGNWHPLTWMSLQADATLFGNPGGPPHPTAVHAVNLGWHLATTLLLFAFLWRCTGRYAPSLVVAALFAVHPLHVESVAWAAERKDVLCAFFWALTLWAYARYAATPGVANYLLVVLGFVLGLLCKPMLVTLPCVLLLLDYWPLRRLRSGTSASPAPFPAASARWLVIEKLPLFCLSAAASVVTILAQRHGNAVVPIDVLPISVRLGNMIVGYCWYLQKTFWPSGLAVYYPHTRTMPSAASLVLGTGLLLGITLAAVLTARRRPWLIVGWLWFLGTLVPVIGLVQVGNQATADRYSYVPHIGLFLAIVWSLDEVLQRWRVPAAVAGGLAAAGILLLAGLTWQQAVCWRNPEGIWRQALAATPNNPVAHMNLAGDLFLRARQAREQAARMDAAGVHNQAAALLQQSQQLYDESEALYTRAVQLDPDAPASHYNLGTVLLDRGHLAEAFEHFTEVVKRQKDPAAAWHNMGIVRFRQRRYREAADCFEHAVEHDPRAPDTLAALGNTLWQLGRRQEAERSLKEALAIHPTEAEALAGMGVVFLRDGKDREAEEALRAALREKPGMAWAYSHLATALGRLGKRRDALDAQQVAVEVERQFAASSPASPAVHLGLALRRLAFRLSVLGQSKAAEAAAAEAARVEPGGPEADIRKAWSLLTDPGPSVQDPRTANELAQCACQLSADPPAEALDVLAASLAALGRFEEAVATASQARARAGGDLGAQIDSRIKLYKQRRALPVKQN